ncbi:MAG TPA: hypothetical protein VMH22_11795 [bacterium]|nr:hypothetical protein [bacterium]
MQGTPPIWSGSIVMRVNFMFSPLAFVSHTMPHATADVNLLTLRSRIDCGGATLATEASGSAGSGLASVGMLCARRLESRPARAGAMERRGLAQAWVPLQKQERRPLRLRERGPERTLFRCLEQMLLRAQAREPLRQQGR